MQAKRLKDPSDDPCLNCQPTHSTGRAMTTLQAPITKVLVALSLRQLQPSKPHHD
ncbi:hypothetical protein SynBIOSE41_03133 [Synechococcus sp. BIOS-E4-1]|nr:hypothetical protein SynBIOSE41_03133 [Synechococcus sp. BIOS-E4-1]